MKYLRIFSNFLEDITGINQEYIFLIVLTILTIIIFKLILYCVKNILQIFCGNSRNVYVIYQKANIILTTINFIIIFILWNNYLDNVITVISFVSAALTLSLKDFVFNFFAGIYIKAKRPFKIDDRIETDNFKGDVVGIGSLSFEILEVKKDDHCEQSTGKIIHVPNSIILSSSLKNYTKNFKYIWSEIVVKTPLDVDSDEVKKVLYSVINSNEVVKRIPEKMRKEVMDISVDYRIYYNKVEPIIYMRVVDDHIEFNIRYLVHPKKNRFVEDDVWSKILTLQKEGKIKLLGNN